MNRRFLNFKRRQLKQLYDNNILCIALDQHLTSKTICIEIRVRILTSHQLECARYIER